jgi:reactive intermediate/imine deaminase
MVFVSGMVSLDAKGQIVGRGDIRAQTKQVLDNVQAVIEAAGAKMTDIAKTTVYITDLANFAAMNEVYKTYFTSDPPARATVKADLVNKDFLVEIDAFAVTG